MTNSNNRSKPVLDQYKEALQPMVDEALAVQNLAPAMQEAIAQNKPLNDALQDVIVEAVKRNPDLRDALDKAISDSNAIKKSKLDYKQPGFWIPIVVTSIIGIAGLVVSILALIKNSGH